MRIDQEQKGGTYRNDLNACCTLSEAAIKTSNSLNKNQDCM